MAVVLDGHAHKQRQPGWDGRETETWAGHAELARGSCERLLRGPLHCLLGDPSWVWVVV